jgi:oligogalacturonide transport system permease protein
LQSRRSPRLQERKETMFTAKQKKQRKLSLQRDAQGLLYIAPWLIGFLALQLYPFAISLYYSLCDYQMMSKPIFIGLQNYIKLFTADVDFWNSLWVTIEYTVLTVPGKLLLALIVALLMNQKLRGINLIRTIYYIPSLFGGSVAVCALWKLMFTDTGVVNAFLGKLGIGPISWLGNPDIAMKTIVMMEIWQFGSSMIMFLAALKNVPQTLYEAAEIDGSSKIHSFFHITLPQITPIILFNLLMQTIQALQNFTSAFVITKGGPMKATYVLGMKLYYDGFSYFKMGYASATSWIIFVIILVATLALMKSSSAWVYYEDGGDF